MIPLEWEVGGRGGVRRKGGEYKLLLLVLTNLKRERAEL